MKAGQLSRHSSTRYPEGGTSTPGCKLDQSTNKTTRGGGKADRTEKGTTTRRTDNKGSNRAHTSTARSAKNQKDEAKQQEPDDADRLPVVVRFPAGPQVSQSKDNGAGHKKEAKQQEHKHSTTHEPHRATHARKHKTTKETEGSTDNACKEQSALDQSKARSKSKTKQGRGTKNQHKEI